MVKIKNQMDLWLELAVAKSN